MCLSIPGIIEELKDKTALVDFGGLKKEIRLDLIDSPKIGEYVLVHAGFAIQRLDKEAAEETLTLIEQANNTFSAES